jgi:DnaJ family protein C protein 17
MDKSELLTLAREYADKNEDLYALLGIDAITAKEEKEVQRAYRKQSIKYHPDKTGSSFSAEKVSNFESYLSLLVATYLNTQILTLHAAVAIARARKRRPVQPSC